MSHVLEGYAGSPKIKRGILVPDNVLVQFGKNVSLSHFLNKLEFASIRASCTLPGQPT